MTGRSAILRDAARYYADKLRRFGARPQGADWNGAQAQTVRFDQILKLLPAGGRFSLNDIGCGYGALSRYLVKKGFRSVAYKGYDISPEMIAAAKKATPGRRFFPLEDWDGLRPADFSVGSGVFHVKLRYASAVWRRYLLDALQRVNRVSRRGFAFNFLTRYSDRDKMRPHLYYADPCELFDYCKRQFSRNVALLHDYGLYEFTLLVRKA